LRPRRAYHGTRTRAEGRTLPTAALQHHYAHRRTTCLAHYAPTPYTLRTLPPACRTATCCGACHLPLAHGFIMGGKVKSMRRAGAAARTAHEKQQEELGTALLRWQENGRRLLRGSLSSLVQVQHAVCHGCLGMGHAVHAACGVLSPCSFLICVILLTWSLSATMSSTHVPSHSHSLLQICIYMPLPLYILYTMLLPRDYLPPGRLSLYNLLLSGGRAALPGAS